jgi:glutamate formiminotransferase
MTNEGRNAFRDAGIRARVDALCDAARARGVKLSATAIYQAAMLEYLPKLERSRQITTNIGPPTTTGEAEVQAQDDAANEIQMRAKKAKRPRQSRG